MTYLLDTGPLGQFVHRVGPVCDRADAARAAGDWVLTITPVVAEILAGLEYSATRERNRAAVARGLALVPALPFTRDDAREYGRLWALLRRRGVQMQVVDLMLAAAALTVKDCVVVSADGDLSRVPGLRVEDWTDPNGG